MRQKPVANGYCKPLRPLIAIDNCDRNVTLDQCLGTATNDLRKHRTSARHLAHGRHDLDEIIDSRLAPEGNLHLRNREGKSLSVERRIRNAKRAKEL